MVKHQFKSKIFKDYDKVNKFSITHDVYKMQQFRTAVLYIYISQYILLNL